MLTDLRTRCIARTPGARVMLVATLTIALVAGIAPPGATSSGHLCRMACCAGKAPHEAGSCLHGGCHAQLKISKPSPPKEQTEACEAHQQMAQHDAMPLLDAASLNEDSVLRANYLREHTIDYTAQDAAPQNNSQQTSIIASALTKPCPPDCGAATVFNSTQSRPRDSAALSEADRPRPPSSLRLPQTPYNPARVLDALCQRSRPRGPPLSFA